jgi:hypothetical protein
MWNLDLKERWKVAGGLLGRRKRINEGRRQDKSR